LCKSINKDKIKETLKKMPNEKAQRPDQIPIEEWKRLVEEGLKWIT